MKQADIRKADKRVCVDLDGVIHSFTTPWTATHIIPDDPVPGAIGWLWEMIQKYEVVIFSARCKSWRGRRAVRQWIKKHAGNMWYPCPGYNGLEDLVFSGKKLAALIYVDDRAWRFEGTFPTEQQIRDAIPWNKK